MRTRRGGDEDDDARVGASEHGDEEDVVAHFLRVVVRRLLAVAHLGAEVPRAHVLGSQVEAPILRDRHCRGPCCRCWRRRRGRRR